MIFRNLLYVTAIVLIFSFMHAYAAEDNSGAAEMILDGGDRGNITFPHSRHQNTLGVCGKCHDLFPKKSGAIQEMISQEKLAKKQVMNNCKNCHRDMKKAGEATGPTSCKKCHDKPAK